MEKIITITPPSYPLNRIVKTIMSHCRIANENDLADKFGIVHRDMRLTKEENMNGIIDEMLGMTENFQPGHTVYLTVSLVNVKKALYRDIFNSGIGNGNLSSAQNRKVEPYVERGLLHLGMESMDIPPCVLHSEKSNTVFKADCTFKVFRLLVEQERKRKPEKEMTAFVSSIAGKKFYNKKSKNELHSGVFNMFTGMSSDMRSYVFNSIYGVTMVEIDFTNSIIQALASRGGCVLMLDAIGRDTLLCDHSRKQRNEEKLAMLCWIFSMFSEKVCKGTRTRCRNHIRNFLQERFGEESEKFLGAIENLPSVHDLFRYEDILRDFCKAHPEAINVHDAVYIPKENGKLIESLKKILDKDGYEYTVDVL
ncbi:hypothetical protein [Akkermansia glycaniphila]|uniref:Uncharacterized protein n=1 Tax=Akkermansia glycaniphila TaxID=1679444 RepID=A0A1C7PAZ9_9BACT|nr:hypothetical protein [Akkermansia glycaniphila]OCA02751.1 hypothetical protein AC781_08655 [Akkermansia glycaniphila]SEH99841.1 Hypothetical protein PYTT_2436 [Akkermansia glycaniphila]